jgi:hypothetical protein
MKRLITFCLTAFALTIFTLVLNAGIASAHALRPAQSLGGCTKFVYHPVDRQPIYSYDDTTLLAYVELEVDGCGWVRGHIHICDAPRGVVELYDVNSGLYLHFQETGGPDGWTNMFPVPANDTYAAAAAVSDPTDDDWPSHIVLTIRSDGSSWPDSFSSSVSC